METVNVTRACYVPSGVGSSRVKPDYAAVVFATEIHRCNER
jgi:hypothetical protein